MALAPGNPALIFDEPGCDLPEKILDFLQQEVLELLREVEKVQEGTHLPLFGELCSCHQN